MSDKVRAKLEVAAVVATGALQIAFESGLKLKPYFMGGAAALWLIYAAARMRVERRRWGFRVDNAGDALWQALPVLLALAGPMAVYAHSKGTLPLPPTAWVIFLAYPLWGLAQQWLLQGLVAANLRDLGARRPTVVSVCTVLFGLAHAPDWDLCALSAAGGFFWTFMFLRVPNLWVLALTHGACGALAFYWVLGIDPLKQAPWAS